MNGESITMADLFAALGGRAKAACAIFWWCYAWHSGAGSSLYKILCSDQLGYVPDPRHNWRDDPEIKQCFTILDSRFGPFAEYDYQPVKLADVKEGDILIAGSDHLCLLNRWPCRVYRWHGTLGVACSGSGLHKLALAKNAETYFHPLQEDDNGHIVGFRR